MVKARILLLDTDYSGVITDCKVEGGSAFIGDYEFFVDKTKPLHIVSGLLGSTIPMYIVKWSSVIPVNFELKEEKMIGKSVKDMLKKKGIVNLKQKILREIENIKVKKDDGEYVKLEDVKKIISNDYKTPYDIIQDDGEYIVRYLEPMYDMKFVKSELPKILRDTFDMRFLKGLGSYKIPKEARPFDLKSSLRKIILTIGLVIIGLMVAWNIITGYLIH